MKDDTRLERARMALEKGCCLELYYNGNSRLAEVHAVGLDHSDRSTVLAYETLDTENGCGGGWRLLPLKDARKVAISGYFSEAPRPGYQRNDSRLKHIIAQI